MSMKRISENIYQVDKNKYRVFVSHGFALDGKRKRFTRTITSNLKGRDLKSFLTRAKLDFEDEIRNKDSRHQDLAKGTLEEYTNWWLNYKIDHKYIEETTKYHYKKMIRNRIVPFAGKQILEKLTNMDMLELMKMIRESKAKTKSGRLSEKSVKHHHTLLSVMFADAIELKILSENPMKDIKVDAPKVKIKDTNFYNLEELKILFDLLTNHASVKHQLATILTVSLGNRGGELTAIRWKDVDLNNRKIRIYESNAYTPEVGSYIKDTKNASSERTLTFPSLLIDLFREHEDNEILKRKMLGKSWEGAKTHEEDFIFTQNNGKAMFVGSLPKWFRKFIKRHNLKHITFHGLRHTNSTLLIAKGSSVRSVSRNLGHSRTSTTTDIYSHHLEILDEINANIFQEILTGTNEIGTKSGTKGEK